MDNIGNRLKEERARIGLTQEKMALAGGIQKRAQARYEAGERCPDGHYLSAIAEIGVDVNYVLTGRYEGAKAANDMPLIDRQAQMYLKMMMSLDENSRRDIFSAIEDKKFIAEMKQERQMRQGWHHAAMA